MHTSSSPITACFVLVALFCFIPQSVIHSQILIKPSQTIALSNALADSVERLWPNVYLMRMDSKLAESLLMAEFSESIHQLEMIGEIVAPAPLQHFAPRAIAAVRNQGQLTFELFKAYICRLYQEYDCEYDLDPDGLYMAFQLAKEIVLKARQSRGPLYMVMSGSGSGTEINALLAFDSANGDFRVVSYAYPLNHANRHDLLHHFDSIVISKLPHPTRALNELATLSTDSLARWNQLNGVNTHGAGTQPRHVWGHRFLWLYRNGEKSKEFGPIVGQLNRSRSVGSWTDAGVDSIKVVSQHAVDAGLVPRIVRTGRLGWSLQLEVTNAALLRERLSLNSQINLSVWLGLISRGENGAVERMGEGNVVITIVQDDFPESR